MAGIREDTPHLGTMRGPEDPPIKIRETCLFSFSHRQFMARQPASEDMEDPGGPATPGAQPRAQGGPERG